MSGLSMRMSSVPGVMEQRAKRPLPIEGVWRGVVLAIFLVYPRLLFEVVLVVFIKLKRTYIGGLVGSASMHFSIKPTAWS